ncbi:hypothetical protein B1992_06915 [Pseudoxanthomonas broegbernensis]|uniref:DUF4398 domain-containing protein n=1 Tax=Pseudoxanthomonas broegbernensis TaxID=83619 RepID=A0A7V8GMQ0_9GAMM|nr:DUF4398 domain-containing protein [Pseudoxanthomonas broegbernensis]KAF1686634.1 hypothetical protein B1992_06915 [Pseudoxanthomonas broegbernensis]MBB6063611.1 multidrug resistance efflux pump [Pseudoxanthomonas broegbernensis]
MNDPSFAHFRRRLYALAVASVLSVTAQAQALPEVQRAEQAVMQAQQADADHYAPDLIGAARQALVQAQAGAASRSRTDRRQAAALAERAAADADLARVRSEQARAESALRQRQGEIAELRQRLGLDGEGAP